LICVEPLQSSRRTDLMAAVAAPGRAGRGPRALFPSIPAYGRFRPLMIQAPALARHGWGVRLTSMDEARSFVEPRVPFEGLGTVPPHPPRTAQVFACATAEPREIVAWVHSLWGSLYDGALAFGNRWTPDLIVCDMVTTCGVDVAEALGVPLDFNNADILQIPRRLYFFRPLRCH
jgi:hypothetical protein